MHILLNHKYTEEDFVRLLFYVSLKFELVIFSKSSWHATNLKGHPETWKESQ